ncbi:MAG: arabinogalactan endo-1,4-beta-galactosidase [Halanaerobiaceae bacterium]|nr:arabinogalactan endo-1,4-beta-galactosidase [Halanaerobiaceae bacterium]
MNRNYSILIFLLLLICLTACNLLQYQDYADMEASYEPTIGERRNYESLDDLVLLYDDPTAKSLKVLPVEGLRDDFIMGADLSMVLRVEECGGVYYNDRGEEQDVFEILKEHGINYLRIRLWNNPYDPDTGESYGGGGNDINTGLILAKRAKRVGMKILLDFHYSDHWADPQKQYAPREWLSLKLDEVEKRLYNYTKETLETFAKHGVRPHMVQIGNEINNGMVWPYGRLHYNIPVTYERLANLLKAGVKAVRDVSPDIQVAIHLAEGASFDRFDFFFGKLKEFDVDYDIIGLSYYPYWHGTLKDLQYNMDRISARYEKPVVVMEYAYGFTDKHNEHTANIYNSGMEAGYKTSFQGQAAFIRDVIDAVNRVPDNRGLGVFYWEPAWLPVEGAGWAEEGTKATWSNQGWFSYSGKATPVLDVFQLVRTAEPFEPEILEIENEIEVQINIAAKETLPETVAAFTELHSYIDVPVQWEDAHFEHPGEYIVKGIVSQGESEYPVTARVTAIENYIQNPGFENRGILEKDIIPPWQGEQSIDGIIKFESKNPRTGSGNLNVWWDSAYSFDLYQEIRGLENGGYRLTVYVRSDSKAAPDVTLYASNFDADNSEIKSDVLQVTSWPVWHEYSIYFTVTNNQVRVGIKGTGDAENWMHMDDFSLVRVE